MVFAIEIISIFCMDKLSFIYKSGSGWFDIAPEELFTEHLCPLKLLRKKTFKPRLP